LFKMNLIQNRILKQVQDDNEVIIINFVILNLLQDPILFIP
jgi:hypothetical protein